MFPDNLLERNRAYTFHRKAEPLPPAEAVPLAVVTCYDPRLDPLLRPALGLGEGEGFLFRTAGAVVDSDGRTLRSLANAVYLFDVGQVLVLGHSSCRMASFSTTEFIDAFRRRGTKREAFGNEDLRRWAGAIASPRQGVLATAAAISAAPFLPPDLQVAGAVLDDTTGALDLVLQPDDSAREALAEESPEPAGTAEEAPPPPPEPPPPEPQPPALSPALGVVHAAVDFLASQPQMEAAGGKLRQGLRTEVDLPLQLAHVQHFLQSGAADTVEIRQALGALRNELTASAPSLLRDVFLPLLRKKGKR